MADRSVDKEEEQKQGLVSYCYQYLNTRNNEIRLLRIPRKTRGPTISVGYRLSHISLQDPGNFIALSYCWGDHTLTQELMVNGQSMYITESLAAALVSLQSQDHDVLLWADAICINQRDPIEKTSQVQLMRDIYRTAGQVIIWLGPSNKETFYTMREMKKLGDQLIELGLWNLSSDEILHWDVEEKDTSKVASTKRAVLQLRSEHLVQARKDEYPFWWIMSDLGKRDWFHASSTNKI
jgi:hypothetical protein